MKDSSISIAYSLYMLSLRSRDYLEVEVSQLQAVGPRQDLIVQMLHTWKQASNWELSRSACVLSMQGARSEQLRSWCPMLTAHIGRELSQISGFIKQKHWCGSCDVAYLICRYICCTDLNSVGRHRGWWLFTKQRCLKPLLLTITGANAFFSCPYGVQNLVFS